MDDKQNKDNPGQPNIDELLKNAQENKAEFGSNQSDDINKNLGSFTNTVQQAEPSATQQIKLDVDAKVIEQASKEKVDFEHFSKTKHDKASKSKFGEKVSLMLRSKKGLRTTWILELVIMAAIIVIGALIIAFITPKMTVDKEHGSPFNIPYVMQCAKVGNVFLWISLFPCAIPLIYLVTAWFIGINQVASSKIYHYMFWGCLAFSLLCFIIGLGVDSVPIVHIAQWGGY